MFFVFIQENIFLQKMDFSVYPDPQVTFSLYIFQKISILPLPSSHQRGKDENWTAFFKPHNMIGHILYGLRTNSSSALIAMRLTNVSK
ncbi:hypothetical protein ES703_70085 [subsurface metagenome]